MKSISKILIALLAVMAFVSCETNHLGPTINPEAERGTLTFVLNEPKYANMTYVLLEENNAATMETLTTSQPNFGFTAAVTYFIEMSLSPDMSDFEVIGSVQGETIPLNVRAVNRGIFELLNGEMPNPTEEMDVYFRLRAVITTVTSSPLQTTPTVPPAYSNVIRLSIMPYFVPNLMPFYLVPGGVSPYYMIGWNNRWNNNPAGLTDGSLIPMSVIEGDHYNIDGQGIFVLTAYFPQGVDNTTQFKFVGRDATGNLGWGNGHEWSNAGGYGIDNPVFGGGNNFRMPHAGYWMITMNTITNTLTFDYLGGYSPTVHANMGVVGTINGWGDTPDIPMTPVFQVNNHLWWAPVTVTATDEIKIRANNSWDVNWGSTLFPRGIATRNGPNWNHNLPAGNYIMFFNDIDGSFTFERR